MTIFATFCMWLMSVTTNPMANDGASYIREDGTGFIVRNGVVTECVGESCYDDLGVDLVPMSL